MQDKDAIEAAGRRLEEFLNRIDGAEGAGDA